MKESKKDLVSWIKEKIRDKESVELSVFRYNPLLRYTYKIHFFASQVSDGGLILGYTNGVAGHIVVDADDIVLEGEINDILVEQDISIYHKHDFLSFTSKDLSDVDLSAKIRSKNINEKFERWSDVIYTSLDGESKPMFS